MGRRGVLFFLLFLILFLISVEVRAESLCLAALAKLTAQFEKIPLINKKIAVVGILKQKNLILMGHRKGSRGAGTWAFVGGVVEEGESVIQALHREAWEEVKLRIKKLKFEARLWDWDKENKRLFLTLIFSADAEGQMELSEPDRAQSWKFIEWGKWPGPLFEPNRRLVHRGFIPSFLKNLPSQTP